MLVISSRLSVVHFDISGKDVKEVQSENKLFIFLILSVFHTDKSGNKTNDVHP